MNDAVHILFALALTAVLLGATERTPYFVAVVGVSFPMSDHFLLTPLVNLGYLHGPIWTHRSITHSLLAGIIFVTIAWYIGHAAAGAIGYGAHLLPDVVLGGAKLFLPVDATVYGGMWLPWLPTNTVVGLLSGLVLLCVILVNLDLWGDRGISE